MILYSRQRTVEGVGYGLGTSLPPRGTGKARGEYGGAGPGSFGCSAVGYTEQHPPYIPHPNQGLKPCSRSLKAKLFGK